MEKGLVSILALDPSLINLGAAYGTLDIDKKVIYVHRLGTYYVDKLIRYEKDDKQLGPTRRSLQVEKVNFITAKMIAEYRVDLVITEEPVFGRNADSLKGQMESISAIRMATLDALKDPLSSVSEDLIIYYPGTIKSALGAAGKDKASQKDSILIALKEKVANGDIIITDGELTLDDVDDHCHDAIAMLVAKARELF